MGAAVRITRTDRTATELRAAAGKCRDRAQVRRMLSLAMVLEGRPRTEAAQQKGMDRQTLRHWVHRYNAGGIDGLKSLQSPGPPLALTAMQMAELRSLVVRGPDPAIHKVMRWRCADLREEVVRRFEVSVHETIIDCPPSPSSRQCYARRASAPSMGSGRPSDGSTTPSHQPSAPATPQLPDMVQTDRLPL